MPSISLRLSNEEKEAMEKYAEFYGITVSELLRDLFSRRLEDESDKKDIKEYEKSSKEGNLKLYSFEKVEKEINPNV